MATLADGTTVLARAVIEHNLAAASRLYTNIYFSELGTLLGVPPLQAETTAARMVQEGRLQVNPLDPISCALDVLRQTLSTEVIVKPPFQTQPEYVTFAAVVAFREIRLQAHTHVCPGSHG